MCVRWCACLLGQTLKVVELWGRDGRGRQFDLQTQHWRNYHKEVSGSATSTSNYANNWLGGAFQCKQVLWKLYILVVFLLSFNPSNHFPLYWFFSFCVDYFTAQVLRRRAGTFQVWLQLRRAQMSIPDIKEFRKRQKGQVSSPDQVPGI